jgi:fibronectin type 3 domain-containing protein
VFRDGTQVGTPTTASFTDTGLIAGSSHSYTVEAVDSGPNTSVQSATLNATTTADNLAPNQPSGAGATAASAGQINVNWTGNGDLPSPGGTGVKGYNIYRCTGATCTPSVITTPVNGATLDAASPYNDTTVSASTDYGYVVTAVDNAGNESAPSSVVRATTPAPTCSGNPSLPGTPTAGARTIGSVAFSWAASTASTGCTVSGYNIYQVNGSTYTLLSGATITGTSTLTATISGLNVNTSYTYAVEAFQNGDGGKSDKTQAATHITIATLADTTAPTFPGSVTATATSPVSLSWTASTDNVGVTGYKVYRCNGASCSNFTLLTTINSATTLNYSDSSVAASTSYTYQVSAIDGAVPPNESTKTTSNSVTTPAATVTAPSAPRTPAAPVVASQSADLTWTAPSTGTVTGYHVYIGNATTQVLDTYSKDTFTSTGGTLSCLAPGVNYIVAIKAFNGSGEGPAVTVPVATPSGGFGADFDCSAHVNSTDLSILATGWQKNNLLPTSGDATGDTIDNSIDLSILATNWNK